MDFVVTKQMVLDAKLGRWDTGSLMLALDGALRVSEFSGGAVIQYLGLDRFKVYQKKTDRDKIVTSADAEFWWQIFDSGFVPKEQDRSRWYWYRLFVKLGWCYKYFGYSNSTVTHVIRHQTADAIFEATKSNELVRDALGNRSIQSNANYVTALHHLRKKHVILPVEKIYGQSPVIVQKNGVIRCREL